MGQITLTQFVITITINKLFSSNIFVVFDSSITVFFLLGYTIHYTGIRICGYGIGQIMDGEEGFNATLRRFQLISGIVSRWIIDEQYYSIHVFSRMAWVSQCGPMCQCSPLTTTVLYSSNTWKKPDFSMTAWYMPSTPMCRRSLSYRKRKQMISAAFWSNRWISPTNNYAYSTVFMLKIQLNSSF